MSEDRTTTSSPVHRVVIPAPTASGTAASHEAAGGGTNRPPMEEPSQTPNRATAEEPRWKTANTIEEYWDARKTVITDKEREDAWTETATIVKEYSDDLVDRWNKEIDTLLVYAGLFSAIQTAFNIELYKRLTPDPDPDPILVALERISAQLSGFAVNQAFVNSTQSPFLILESTPTTPAVPLWVVVLNTLWFSSLISSLAAASIGIMVKQWLTEYKSGVSGTSRQTARLRQLRFNSLQRWRVREIVSILPVLLQIASGLFFSGLLILLWNLNRTVAIVGTILVGILAAFSLSTIVLPSVATHCSYLSPPSRALFELVRMSCKGLYHLRLNLSTWLLGRYNATSALFYFQYGSSFGPFMRRHPVIHGVCKMLFPSDASSTLAWRGTESALVSQHTETLDGEMVATAYATSMDTNYLHHAAVCTTELTLGGTRTCLGSILAANIAHWGEGELMGPMRSVHPCMWSSALLALMSVVSNDTAWSPTTVAAAMKTAHDYMRSSSLYYHSDAPATRLVWVDLVRIIRHYDYDPNTLPPHSLNIAHRIYISELLAVVKTTQDMRIGNDIRQQGHCLRLY
ncbi:hypothetical protein OH76DRAFT_522713 [Lentinus brumalis]|uniref:DUF6535 domain-containing protein n=1 Tax=Lentinus brumalis TaxID=2498619 RepID=A0A371DAU7_9APHY|nr:hypothetical protein OH76DRAFT_522713 [Polyporus brumalis]